MISASQEVLNETEKVDNTLRRNSDSALLTKATQGLANDYWKNLEPHDAASNRIEEVSRDDAESETLSDNESMIRDLETRPQIASIPMRELFQRPPARHEVPYLHNASARASAQPASTQLVPPQRHTINISKNLLHLIENFAHALRQFVVKKVSQVSETEMRNVDVERGPRIMKTVDGTNDERQPSKEPKPPKRRRGYFLFPDSPSFSQYMRTRWKDMASLALCGALTLIIYRLVHPIPRRLFPVVSMEGQVSDPSLAYPRMAEYISTLMSALISFVVPAVFIILVSLIAVKSFWDCDSAIFGLQYALVTAALFQIFIKVLIGGLRPHFLATCNPMLHEDIGEGFLNIMFDRSICRGRESEINEAMMSFPSGHSCAAFAGFGFLALWLNAKFKIFANYRTCHWKLVLFSAPLLIAVLLAASKIIDYWHHWYDVLVGAIIGAIFALMAYRCHYASIWNYRTNHIPLCLIPTQQDSEEIAFRDLTATQKAGWGRPHGSKLPGPSSADAANTNDQAAPNAHLRNVHPPVPPITSALDGTVERTVSGPLSLPSMDSSLHVASGPQSRIVSAGNGRAGERTLPSPYYATALVPMTPSSDAVRLKLLERCIRRSLSLNEES